MTEIRQGELKAFYPGAVSLLDEIKPFILLPEDKSLLGKVTSCMNMFQSTNGSSSFCSFYKGKEDKEGKSGTSVDESKCRCYREQNGGRAVSMGT